MAWDGLSILSGVTRIVVFYMVLWLMNEVDDA